MKEGLLEVHLSYSSNWFKYPTHRNYCILSIICCAACLFTCSFCCDLWAAGVSLSSADVGVILRIIPPLLAVLPDTKAAKSLRNSPEWIKKKNKMDLSKESACCCPLAHLWWTYVEQAWTKLCSFWLKNGLFFKLISETRVHQWLDQTKGQTTYKNCAILALATPHPIKGQKNPAKIESCWCQTLNLMCLWLRIIAPVEQNKGITILKTELHFNQKKRPGHASPTTQLSVCKLKDTKMTWGPTSNLQMKWKSSFVMEKAHNQPKKNSIKAKKVTDNMQSNSL